MTLQELQNLYWWSIDDNPANPLLMDATTLTRLINDAVADLGKSLRIIKYAEIIPANGVVTLPSDLIEIERAIWDDGDERDLYPIDNVNDAKTDCAAVIQYYFLERLKVQLFDSTVALGGTMNIWYKAYPAELVNAVDVPVHIPVEYHKMLVTVYVRAMHAFKLGHFAIYQTLMAMWDDIKNEVGGTTDARTKPVAPSRRFDW